TALQPEHISAYGLQLEAGTQLAEDVKLGLKSLPAEDEVVEMMDLAMTFLPDKGYQHYEISNYAKPGFQSAHNLVYWRGGDYLGFGAGAYSTVAEERWYNIENPEVYIETVCQGTSPIKSREKLSPKIKAAEALMLGLRLRAGVDLGKYKAEFGIDLLKTAEPYLTNFLEQKLLVLNESRLALTDAGIGLSNSVISSLLLGI
ncbi:MAG: coproporphyrinogen III oxidase, partial [Bacteroidota bacterium]